MITGSLIGGRYRLMERKNQGSSGVVWRAEELLQGKPIAEVAMKVFTVEVNHSEIAALARLQHSHILGYRTVVEHEGRVCLVTEYADGGDLAQMLQAYPDGLPLPRVVEVVTAVAEALRYLHEQSWVHRDVKPSNILYVGSVPKLGDVGTAKAIGHAMTRHTGIGSMAYSAPEMFSGQVGPTSDIYGLGVTALELLTGRLPFNGSAEQVMRQHLQETPVIPSEFPEAMRSFLAGSLIKDPAKRLDARSVLDLFQTRSAGKFATATAAAPPVHPSPQAAAPASVQPSAGGATPVTPVSMDTASVPSPTPAQSSPRARPEQIAADMTRRIRNHFQQYASSWERPENWGPFWQELQQLSQPLGLSDSDLLRQVQALRKEIDPPTPPPAAKPRPAVAAQGPARGATPPTSTANTPTTPKPAPAAVRSPVPQAVRLELIELIQVYGDRWSQSDVWQPFLTKMTQTSPSLRERDAIQLGEELERQLDAQAKQQQQLQLRVLQWVSGQGGRGWTANDWGRFLDQLSGDGFTDDAQAARHRDEGLQRLFPKQTGEIRRLRLRSDLSLDLVFLGRDVLESAVPLTDLAETVFSREEKQARTRLPPSAAKGVWLTVSPVTIAQWYALLQHPLPAAATKPEAVARVLQRGIQTEYLPRLKRRFPLEDLRLATRAEAHALRQILKPDEAKQKPGSSRSVSERRAEPTLLGLLGAAAAHVITTMAEENQEWFQNDSVAPGDATTTRKLPFRLVSIVPG